MAFTVKYFHEMPIGTIFTTTPSGSAYEWMKVSTRTARMGGNGAWYYFRKMELCHVDRGHWEEMARELPNKEGVSHD